jgi:hypothetical protein
VPDNQDKQDKGSAGYAPAALGSLAALGTGAALYRALRKRRLSKDPALRAMQLASGGRYTRVLPGSAKNRNWLERFADKYLATGGGDVIYQGDEMLRSGKRVIPGLVHHSDRSFNEVLSGAAGDLAANKATKDLYERIKNDKWKEYQFFNRYAKGEMGRSENIASIARKLGYDTLPETAQERRIFLAKLEHHLKQKYPEGFLLKDTLSAETAGSFPTEKTPFHDLYERYMAADPNKKLTTRLEEQGKGLDPTALKSLRKKLRQQISDEHADVYAGRVFEKMFKKPELAMVQAKLPLEEASWFGRQLGRITGKPATKELRVHVVNGVVVPSLTVPRFDPSMYVAGRHHMRSAEDYVRGLIARTPKKYQGASYAFDVAPLKTGRMGLIESNPSGVSGFYSPKKHPIVGPLMHRAFTGQHSRPIAATLAAGGSLAAGAGAYSLGKQFNLGHHSSEEQHPNSMQGASTPYTKAAMYRVRQEKLADDTSDDSRASKIDPALLAAAGVGALPLAGLIGQKKIQHDPYFNKSIPRMSRKELERLAQPGDILVAGKSGFEPYKFPQEIVTGSSFYHAEPVVTRWKDRGLTMDAGHIYGMDGPEKTRSLKVMEDYARDFSPHENMVLLRPKKPLSPEQMKSYLKDITWGGSNKYQVPNTVSAWLHDLLAPKVNLTGKARYECTAGICSTVPGQALANVGREVVPGVKGRYLMPADFLRSEHYSPVGASLGSKMKPSLLRRAAPYLSRAALGALLAAAAYPVAKRVLRPKDEEDASASKLGSANGSGPAEFIFKSAAHPETNAHAPAGAYRFNRTAESADIDDARQYVFKAHDRKPHVTGNESSHAVPFLEGVSG